MILLLVKDGDWQVYCGDNVGYAMTDTQQNQLRQAIGTTYYSGDVDGAGTPPTRPQRPPPTVRPSARWSC